MGEGEERREMMGGIWGGGYGGRGNKEIRKQR